LSHFAYPKTNSEVVSQPGVSNTARVTLPGAACAEANVLYISVSSVTPTIRNDICSIHTATADAATDDGSKRSVLVGYVG
jgi:hypothetical protein